MKYHYHNNDLRATVEQKKDCSGNYLQLNIEKRHKWWLFHWWAVVKWVHVEIDNYWGYIPGDKLHGGHMTLSYQFGGSREIWPPGIFDLKTRVRELINEYLKETDMHQQKEKDTLKQLSTL